MLLWFILDLPLPLSGGAVVSMRRETIHRGGERTILGFVADARKPSLGEPLNGHFAWYGDARAPQEVQAPACLLSITPVLECTQP